MDQAVADDLINQLRKDENAIQEGLENKRLKSKADLEVKIFVYFALPPLVLATESDEKRVAVLSFCGHFLIFGTLGKSSI